MLARLVDNEIFHCLDRYPEHLTIDSVNGHEGVDGWKGEPPVAILALCKFVRRLRKFRRAALTRETHASARCLQATIAKGHHGFLDGVDATTIYVRFAFDALQNSVQ